MDLGCYDLLVMYAWIKPFKHTLNLYCSGRWHVTRGSMVLFYSMESRSKQLQGGLMAIVGEALSQ